MTHTNGLRLVLGALLLAGMEGLTWAGPGARALLEWPALLLGYTVLAALLLDLALRFRLRDGFGVLALAGLAAISAALLLNPGYALANPPLTWFTRALGAMTVGALLAWLVFLRLARPLTQRGVVVVALLAGPLGALWGYWARWSPAALDANMAPATVEHVLGAGLLMAALIGLTLALAARLRTGEAAALRLKPLPLALLTLGMLAVLVARVLTGSLDTLSALALPMLGLVAVGVLYYQKREKGATLLDRLPALPPLNWARGVLPIMGIALAVAVVGAQLPRGDPDDGPLLILSAALTAFGVLWLPGVALVIAARAFSRLARTDRL